MGKSVIFLIVGIPIIEIITFIEIGGYVGVWPTIGAIIITAILGAVMLRKQGLSTLLRVQESLSQKLIPINEMFDGLCLILAGIFLLTPGFVTDFVGFLIFIPQFRLFFRELLLRKVSGSTWFHQPQFSPKTEGKCPNLKIIEAEYEDLTSYSETKLNDRSDIPK